MTALYFFGSQITWTGIIIALACAAALLAGSMLRKYQQRGNYEFLICAALSCLFGVVGSRLMYWYCNTEAYSRFLEVFTASDAGQSVGGMMLGVVAAVCLTGLVIGKDEILRLFDCICTAGALGLFVGRLAGFTNTGDRGRMIFESAFLQRLPFASPVAVEGSSDTEWRFATFLFESAAGLFIFIVCVSFFVRAYEKGKESNCEGLTALLFCALFGSTQAILESTRYDSLFFRFNGFVSIVQIIAAVLLVGSLVVGFVVCGKLFGKTNKSIILLVGGIALVGCAGAFEYFVQRYTHQYPLWYGLMLLAVGGACAISWSVIEKILCAKLSENKTAE